MRLLKLLLLVPMLVALGCPATPKSTSTPAAKAPVAKDGAVAPDTGASEESEVALQAPAAGAVKINPQNTKIEFVGTKPEGKHEGGFKKFLGGIEVKDDKVAKIAVEIDTSSLYADNPKLTGHLKSPDFFDVKTHPKSAFASTEVKAEDGKGTTHVVTGDFTLHGVKKSIAFPAKIDVAATAVTVASEFKINRSDFGMTFGQGKVDDPVTIKVSVKAPRQ